MADPRVPRTINGFNDWILRTDARLQGTNPVTSNLFWKDYGLDTNTATTWHNNQQAWLPIMLTHGGRHDSVDNEDLQKFIKSMAAFAEKPLLVIAGSPIVGSQEAFIFNFKIGHADPTSSHTQITEQVASIIRMEGHGLLDIKCLKNITDHRASKPANADGIQCGHAVINRGGATGSTAQTDPSTILPTDASMKFDTQTHAHFHLDLGANSVGNWLVIYFRWYNTKHPELAGPWSVVQIMVIG